MFPTEEIPDKDSLFRRYNYDMHIHKKGKNAGKLKANAFKETGDGPDRGMSCDWDRYSTAVETRNRVEDPAAFGVVKISVGALREIKLTVLHHPDQISESSPSGNQSHSLVKGIDPLDGSDETSLRGRILLDCAPEIIF